MSWPGARKVLAAVSRTAVLGVAGGLAGPETWPVAGAGLAGEGELAWVTGALDDDATAELPDELQAVTSKAAQAIPAQAATCRARRPFVINMMSNPSTLNFPIAARGAMSPIRRPRRRHGWKRGYAGRKIQPVRH
jgi:hypothetical protein